MTDQQSEEPQSGSFKPSPTPAPTPTPTPASPPAATSAPPAEVYDPTKIGRKIIYKNALEDLISDINKMLYREELESEYRGSLPAINARTDRSDAGELRGRYTKEFHPRVAAIKTFLVEELDLPKDDYSRDNVLFYDMSSEVGNEVRQTVVNKIRQRLGWLAENADRL